MNEWRGRHPMVKRETNGVYKVCIRFKEGGYSRGASDCGGGQGRARGRGRGYEDLIRVGLG